ncbi:IS3 family transposase [Orrella dioscoreae]|uniref:IS3 family transposase n=1 Tax=Orrella dioscoreae TaxID=1851544 RepID=UPI000BF0E760|nr:IS3 family transposase [Orrella dioscoreae]
MAKYDEQFKLRVVRRYLSGSAGAKTVGAEQGLGHATVRRWVQSYREHGLSGLRRKGASYDAAFKLQVLRRMRQEHWSQAQTAAAFNIRCATHIGKWARQYDAGGLGALAPKRRGRPPMPHKPPPAPIPTDMTAEQMREELAYLRAENDYLKKLKALIEAERTGSAGEKAQIVQGLRPTHPLSLLLRAAKLSRSTFYYHLKAQGAVDQYAALKAKIRAIYTRHKGRYGYRRITAALRQAGQCVNHKTVQKLMRALGLKSLVRPKRYRSYRGEVGRVAPNVLARQFEADRPNQKWVTDVTEFNVRGQKLYLSPVMDLYNGEIVAYETSERPLFGLVGNMLKKAMRRLSPGDQPLLHSDQGWQYQQPSYRRMLADRGLTQSMSRKGNCLDNAAMESWFATLKTECFYLRRYDSIEQLQKAIGQFIHYYNHQRIRLKLKGLSPVQYRTQALAA